MRIGNLYLHIGSCDGIVEDKLTAWIGVVKHSFDDVTTYIFFCLRLTIDKRKR
jgi:hypothetical protein